MTRSNERFEVLPMQKPQIIVTYSTYTIYYLLEYSIMILLCACRGDKKNSGGKRENAKQWMDAGQTSVGIVARTHAHEGTG